MSVRLKAAIARRRRAEDDIQRILHRDYAPGAEIVWNDGFRMRRGVVVMNCTGDRIKVRNDATGRERFITAFQIRCWSRRPSAPARSES